MHSVSMQYYRWIKKIILDMTYVLALMPVIIIFCWPIRRILKLLMFSTFRDSTDICGWLHVILHINMTCIGDIKLAFSHFDEIDNYWFKVIFLFFLQEFGINLGLPQCITEMIDWIHLIIYSMILHVMLLFQKF